jgi:hypothetical protein
MASIKDDEDVIGKYFMHPQVCTWNENSWYTRTGVP